MAWSGALPYFAEHELACRGSGAIRLHDTFAAALPALRLAWGPLTPTSVCRSIAYNVEVGGHPRSLHLTDNPHHPTDGCMAADIDWSGWSEERRLAFAQLAWDAGWSLGLHCAFCHIDRRRDIDLRQTVFKYTSWGGAFGSAQITEYV